MVKKTNRKVKEKVLFAIPWTHKYQTKVTIKLLKKTGLIVIITFIILMYGLGSNAFAYSWGVIRCGHLPVESGNLMSSSYTLPGEKGYGLNSFASYQYCTQQEAESAGYHRDTVTLANQEQAAQQQAARAEAEKFSPSKVSYTVYVPTAQGYVVANMKLSTIQSNIHTFYDIKKNGTIIGQVRELGINDSYNICDPHANASESYCKVIGHDAAGREIKREFTKGIKDWRSSYTGVNIGGTGIILQSDDDTEAVTILSSMQIYSEK